MNGSRQRVTPPPPLGAFADGEQTAAAEAHERETLPAPAHSEREVAAAFEAAREDPREDPTPLFVRARRFTHAGVPADPAEDQRDTLPPPAFAAGDGFEAWPDSLDLRAPGLPALDADADLEADELAVIDIEVDEQAGVVLELEVAAPASSIVDALEPEDPDVHDRPTLRPPSQPPSRPALRPPAMPELGPASLAAAASELSVDETPVEASASSGTAPLISSAPPALRSDAPSSLSPAERAASAPRPRSRWGTAALLAVALLVGLGGWLLMPSDAVAPMAGPATPPPSPAGPVAAGPMSPEPPSAPVAPPSEAAQPGASATHAPKWPRARRRDEAPVASSTLPDKPERSEVVAALASVQSEVAACRKERSGVAEVELIISGAGRVTHARVVGDFAGTPEGSCVARAVRKATVPPFKQDRLRILYPFTL